MKPTRQTVIGKLCKTHPELNGLRYTPNRTCVECAKARSKKVYGARELNIAQEITVLRADNHKFKAENERLSKDLESHKRMLLNAAISLGAIGEALGAEMDDDASELEGLALELRKDAERLDWLDGQSRPIIEGQSISNPEGELSGYEWGVFGACSTVREAIDHESMTEGEQS